MANYQDEATWEANVYIIAENDPVQGGENGIDNIPHQQLANRTAYLKKAVETVDKKVADLAVPADQSQAIKDLQTGLGNEIEARKEADTAINQQISGLSTSIDYGQEITQLHQTDTSLQNQIDAIKNHTMLVGATVTVIFNEYDKYVGNGKSKENLNNVIITGIKDSQIPYTTESVRTNVLMDPATAYRFQLPSSVTSESQLIINSHLAEATIDIVNKQVLISPYIKKYDYGQDGNGFWAIGNASVTIVN